ncbi:MAG TPA: DUF4198 domain-containing protein [Blastocatellia bacterium]|jgi:uncharacterized GH25 family protein|nr:DUF4198 domain-containing protein [Blastocatellia bacterium]
MKTLSRRGTGLTFAVCLILCTSVVAHDTWLIPDRFAVPREGLVSLDLTSGMAFPALDSPIKPDRIDRALCRLSGHQFDIKDYSGAPKSLRFKAKLDEPGIATFSVELKPRSLELTPAQVREYLHEIDAPAAIRQQWNNARRPRRWREVYTKHSKTFVKVGEPESDRSWAEPIGTFLEIVPEKDPTTLKAGDEFPIRVLKEGAPLSGFPIGLVHESGPKARIGRTDAGGRVTFRLDRKGRWLLRGTELRKSIQASVDWESNFTTLTIQVGTK